MALVLADRVQETTSTTGTGALTLSGAIAGYQSFAVVGDGNTCYYTIVNTTAWEVGIGTYSTTGPTLARTTVLSNSNGDTSPITLVGASSVFLTYPAEKSVNLDADGVLSVGSALGYSDTGIIASFVSTETDYNQVIIQNKSTSPTASANLNISNDASTGSEGFVEVGINSSTFTGPGSFDIAGASYLASASTDLTIGTYGAYNIHFVTNSNSTDAMTIYDDGGISLGELANPGIGNIACNNINLKFQQVTTTGGTTFLTNASPYYTQFTGTDTQTLQLPDATTCLLGTTLIFDNDSTQNVDIADGAGTVFELLVPGGFHTFVLENNSTVAGTWLRYSQVPSAVEWGTLSLSLGATVISGGTWEGGTIQAGYGGTGLTSFVAANNAIYSTGATTLTAGTLPVAAGGTGVTSLAVGYIPYGNGSSYASSSSLQFASGVLVVGGSSVLGGATNPITAFTGSTNNYIQTYVYNQSTGTSASADFVAYTNNSTDAHGWADLGFTSSTYADPVYTVTGPNEAYVLGSALNSSFTGNLVYATDFTGSENAHQWYVGGFTQLKSAWKMQLTSTGLQLANALGTAYGGTGLTSFTSGGAVYATSTSALTTGTLPVTSGGTGVTTSTGSGANVLATSPTLVTPILGTPQSGNFSTGTFTWPTFNQNTSGNAATATNVAWSGVTSKPSNLMFYEGFTLDANTMSSNATGFTYAVNAPWTGPIARLSAGGSYDLELNAPYSAGNNLSYRTRNGDTGSWNSWYSVLNTSGGSMTGAITSSASTLMQSTYGGLSRGYLYGDSDGFGLLHSTGGWAIRIPYSTSNAVITGSATASYFWTGYDSGVTSSVSCSNWFRTSGAPGLYYASYGRGIQAADVNSSYGNNQPYGSGLNGWQGWAVGTNNDCILMTNGATHGFYNPVGGVWQQQMDDSGNVTFNGNVTAYSDLRLKENVREIDNVVARRDTLAKAAIKYERDGRTRVGYGAQTLRDNGCAEFVMEADDALKMATGLGTLSVDYGETTAVLAVTSKMTDDRVAALEARIAQLENTWFKKVANACRNLIARH